MALSTIFAPIKSAFSGIAAKVLLALLIAACVVAFIFYQMNKSNAKELQEKTTELATTKTALETTRKTLEVLQGAGKINENTNNNVAKETIVYRDKIVYVDRKVQVKEGEIKDRYDSLPKTPENKKAEQDELSTVRLQGIWDRYCVGAASAPGCTKSEETKK